MTSSSSWNRREAAQRREGLVAARRMGRAGALMGQLYPSPRRGARRVATVRQPSRHPIRRPLVREAWGQPPPLSTERRRARLARFQEGWPGKRATKRASGKASTWRRRYASLGRCTPICKTRRAGRRQPAPSKFDPMLPCSPPAKLDSPRSISHLHFICVPSFLPSLTIRIPLSSYPRSTSFYLS